MILKLLTFFLVKTRSVWASLYKLLGRLHLVNPTVIIMVDGGICSQMFQYLMGYYIKHKKQQPIQYNMLFYRYSGKGDDGISIRNFDLLKAFPYLEIDIAKIWKCFFYNQIFPYCGYTKEDFNKPWYNVSPPMSILGYFSAPKELFDLFKEVFVVDPNNVLDNENLKLYNKIGLSQSCAVHVRRGDLVSDHGFVYGNPVSITYLVNAIQYINRKYPSTNFYFFSDDKEYVRNYLIPKIPFLDNYIVVENGEEKGYVDMILISKCNYQICSKGSLGKYGAMLSTNLDKEVVVSKNDNNISILSAYDGAIVKL